MAGLLVGGSAGRLHGFLSGFGSSSPGGLFPGALPAGELFVGGGSVGLFCAVPLGLDVAVGWAASTWRLKSSSAMFLLVSTGCAYCI